MPPEFTGNEDPGHAGLELRCQRGQVDAATLGAEHQRDRAYRTGRAACTVADAVTGTDQAGLAVDQSQHRVLRQFRAGTDTGRTADARRRIDQRMQRDGLGESRALGVLLGVCDCASRRVRLTTMYQAQMPSIGSA